MGELHHSRYLAALALIAAVGCSSPAPRGVVTVAGQQLLRDGKPWAPHGLNLIAFVAPPAAQMGVFADAYQHFDHDELVALQQWGADTVRFQVAQPGLDPQNPLFTQDFVDRVVAAVTDARQLGLAVLVSVQDETQSGEPTPTLLPDDATTRVWQTLAPHFNGDRGILYEILNEPEPKPSASDWSDWRDAMDGVVAAIRGTGSHNVVVADGLQFALTLDGAPAVADAMGAVAYAVHPYFHSAADEAPTAWDTKFGAFAAQAPVVVTEWTTVGNAAQSGSSYFCDDTTAAAALGLLQYLDGKAIGITAYAYDFSGNLFGSAVYGFPPKTSSFANGAKCGDAGYGPGTLLQNWYRDGHVPAMLE